MVTSGSNEKLFSLKFIKYMPPTLISENLDEIKEKQLGG